ncbi:uncharacterized protein DS421_10g294910 [Arachis hypogaea]|nr:uncharacterized protein DS421_10g294910 [Arachis hypogaea]
MLIEGTLAEVGTRYVMPISGLLSGNGQRTDTDTDFEDLIWICGRIVEFFYELSAFIESPHACRLRFYIFRWIGIVSEFYLKLLE